MGESGVQTQTRLVCARAGKLMYRNNSGAFKDQTGRWVRFGLGNDSISINEEFKSSDLIGVSPYLVTQADVGRIVGIATALELKDRQWSYSGTDREIAQANFMRVWREHGGFAGFISDPQQVFEVCRYETR